jgi:addiction module RelE/StbE family toxin
MNYSIIASPEVQKTLRRILKRDPVRYLELEKKLLFLSEHPEIGKPLKNVLKGKRRIHIGSYVLLYNIQQSDHTIVLISFDHHDDVYD